MIKKYTEKEERANTVTHGMGTIFAIVVLIVLLVISIRKEDTLSIVAFSIYGGCLIFMYLSSTLYHSCKNEKIKNILRVFDHSSIYLFIAGTYTPVVLLTLKGKLRIGVMIAVWAIAIFGVIYKIVTAGKFDKYKGLSLLTYIGMGWIAVFVIKPVVESTSINFLVWLLAGGIVYSLGTIFYSKKTLPYNHAVWHVFVIAGTVLHFVGILKYLA